MNINNIFFKFSYVIVIWSLAWPAFGIQTKTTTYQLTSAQKKQTAEQDLILFSKQGREALVYKALSQGVSPNGIDENNNSALFYALEQQHYSIAHLLINANANVDHILKSGLNLLMFFIQKNDKQALQLLLNNHVNFNYQTAQKGDSALLLATNAKKTKIVKLLLQAGADPNLANHEGLIPLVIAIKNRSINITTALLQNGANIDQLSRPMGENFSATPLIHFATYGDAISIFALLRLGANINLTNEINISPLGAAALVGNLDIVRLLLDAGADPKQVTTSSLWQHIKNRKNPIIAKTIEAKLNLQ